jgi:hypothetical protein
MRTAIRVRDSEDAAIAMDAATSEMNEQRAREILASAVYADSDELCGHIAGGFLSWTPGRTEATLIGGEGVDGFGADELEAIAWWMRNKKGGSA